jgi:hypothetical protein
MYATALINRFPAFMMAAGSKRDVLDERRHEITVVSREAERMRSLVGDAIARTFRRRCQTSRVDQDEDIHRTYEQTKLQIACRA